MRETLFNWLQPRIEGAKCLDLFAGSGALAFEAASRGAARVLMVESNPATVRQLYSQITLFQGGSLVIQQGSALEYLQQLKEPQDVIFLDPPFHSDLLRQSLQLIDPPRHLRRGGRIYLEYPSRSEPELPSGLVFQRQKKAGEVGYGLAGFDQA